MTLPNRRGPKPLPFFLIIAVLMPVSLFAQHRQPSESTQTGRRGQEQKAYHESRLRRFEIITLTSLPFTAIHSYLVVRGLEMIKQNKFAPELSTTKFRIIGASSVSFALFIGFWDWLRTHREHPSQQLIPASPSKSSPAEPTRKLGAANWGIAEAADLTISLVHVAF